MEVLVVIAGLALVVAVGLVAVLNANNAARETKLRQDVASLNRAVQTYHMSGGNLSTATNATEVIAKLKTTMRNSERSTMAGLRSSMIDARLTGLSRPPKGSCVRYGMGTGSRLWSRLMAQASRNLCWTAARFPRCRWKNPAPPS